MNFGRGTPVGRGRGDLVQEQLGPPSPALGRCARQLHRLHNDRRSEQVGMRNVPGHVIPHGDGYQNVLPPPPLWAANNTQSLTPPFRGVRNVGGFHTSVTTPGPGGVNQPPPMYAMFQPATIAVQQNQCYQVLDSVLSYTSDAKVAPTYPAVPGYPQQCQPAQYPNPYQTTVYPTVHDDGSRRYNSSTPPVLYDPQTNTFNYVVTSYCPSPMYQPLARYDVPPPNITSYQYKGVTYFETPQVYPCNTTVPEKTGENETSSEVIPDLIRDSTTILEGQSELAPVVKQQQVEKKETPIQLPKDILEKYAPIPPSECRKLRSKRCYPHYQVQYPLDYQKHCVPQLDAKQQVTAVSYPPLKSTTIDIEGQLGQPISSQKCHIYAPVVPNPNLTSEVVQVQHSVGSYCETPPEGYTYSTNNEVTMNEYETIRHDNTQVCHTGKTSPIHSEINTEPVVNHIVNQNSEPDKVVKTEEVSCDSAEAATSVRDENVQDQAGIISYKLEQTVQTQDPLETKDQSAELNISIQSCIEVRSNARESKPKQQQENLETRCQQNIQDLSIKNVIKDLERLHKKKIAESNQSVETNFTRRQHWRQSRIGYRGFKESTSHEQSRADSQEQSWRNSGQEREQHVNSSRGGRELHRGSFDRRQSGYNNTQTEYGNRNQQGRGFQPQNRESYQGREYGQQNREHGQQNTEHGQQNSEHGQQNGEHGQQNRAYGQQNREHSQQNTEPGQQNTEHGQQKTEHGQQKTEPGQQNRAYGQQNREHGQQNRDYGQQNREHGQQSRAYGQQNTEHGQQKTEHGQQNRAYGQQNRDYGQQNRDYGQQNREHGQQNREHGQQNREQGQQNREHGQQNREYGQQNRDYGQQNREHGQQNREHGQQNREQGQQNREHGQQNREYGQQNREYGQQNREHGQQNREYGQQNREHGQQNKDYNQNRNTSGSQSNPSSTTVPPEESKTYNFRQMYEKAEEQRLKELALKPKIVKDVYVEHDDVRMMTPEDADTIRENKRIQVKYIEKEEMKIPGSVVAQRQKSPRIPIPNLVRTFAECFSQYPEIMNEIAKQGFDEPSPIQCQLWPCIMQGQDVVGIAQTGSGKTLAFLLPALIHIEMQSTPREMRKSPTVLILAPTRELAQQIDKEVNKYNYKNIRSVCVYGGGSRYEQIEELRTQTEIVIATPGRLNDLVAAGKINLDEVSFLVLDEADEMLNQGFEPQINKALLYVRGDRQTIMTSATWPAPVRRIADKYTENPVLVTVGGLDVHAVRSVKQHIHMMDTDEERMNWIVDFVRVMTPVDKAIIFVNQRALADHLSSDLTLKNFCVQTIHGTLCQEDREQAIQDLHTGKARILVATDVAARGIDIENITHVINHSFPPNVQQYVHRIGRTGRAGRSGESHTFIGRRDWDKAQDIIGVLEEAQQKVPDELREMAQRFEAKKQSGGDNKGGRGGRRGGFNREGGSGNSFGGGQGSWGQRPFARGRY